MHVPCLFCSKIIVMLIIFMDLEIHFKYLNEGVLTNNTLQFYYSEHSPSKVFFSRREKIDQTREAKPWLDQEDLKSSSSVLQSFSTVSAMVAGEPLSLTSTLARFLVLLHLPSMFLIFSGIYIAIESVLKLKWRTFTHYLSSVSTPQ